MIPPVSPRLRNFLPRLAGALAAALLASAALAAPPPDAAELPQVPGYYRQPLGQLRITALFDGVVPLPRGQIAGLPEARVASLLDHRYVPETPQGMQTAVNAYLVERAGQLLLVDAGTARCFGGGLGHVMENLRLAGYRPEQVDTILITHAHPDHLCGVADDAGAMAFPNATLWIARADDDFVRDAAAEARMPEGLRFLFPLARKMLAPYAAAGRLRLFGAGDPLPDGVSLLPSPGHTPGHSSFLIDGGADAKLLIWGDVVHYHAVQFAAPEASYEVDVDRARAIVSRRALMADAARHGWWVAGAHLPFPGLGHVRVEGKAYAWLPAEFSPLPTRP
ncbi:MBL fold metallo-hydrolase [Derxia lacustris]|uniref:MBL fold metallo-hydrolase n=1 Tax=Derxia lacustris TaxID=764842 RepID=UPI000A1762F9|nr:MBL fold metallo-hydrolase [Derxia lacustris]